MKGLLLMLLFGDDSTNNDKARIKNIRREKKKLDMVCCFRCVKGFLVSSFSLDNTDSCCVLKLKSKSVTY